MYKMPQFKVGDCRRCDKINVPVRKRGKELVCVWCCQVEDKAKQMEKAKLKPQNRKTPSRNSDFGEEESSQPSFFNLIADIDKYFSIYVRLKEADASGVNSCFTCGKKYPWKELQAGHYIPRTHLLTRFDLRNCRPQCKACNEFLAGNLAVYTRKLEAECKGITDELLELSRQIFKPSQSELKGLLIEYKERAKLVQLKIKA